MVKFMQIDAVVFDLDHTLVIDHHLELDVLRTFMQSNHLKNASDSELLSALQSFRTGKEPMEKALGTLFKRLGAPKSKELVGQWRSAVLKEAPRRIEVLPGASEVLLALKKRGTPMGIFTNGWHDLQAIKVAALKWDGIYVVSEAIDAWKPAKIAFERALLLLNFNPATTLYVGDAPEADVVGAKNAGMLAAWLNCEKHNYPPGLLKPDLTLNRLQDLLELLPESD